MIKYVHKCQNGIRVYAIKGMGYWKCPKYVSISWNSWKKQVQLQHSFLTEVSEYIYADPNVQDFLSKLEILLKDLNAITGLWDTMSYVTYKNPAVTNYKNGFLVSRPACLNQGKIDHTYTEDLEEANRLAVEYGSLARSMSRLSLEEALTFHPMCHGLR